LVQEGVERTKIYFVGNIMIDSLVSILKRIDQSYEDEVFQKFGLERNNFVLVTLHRPSNVDNMNNLRRIMKFLEGLSLRIPIIFPVHPRTRKAIADVGTDFYSNGKFHMVEPLRYKEFIALEKNPKFVITDSGGIQEETTYFRVPCLTLRPNTERPITITQGTNELVSLENAEEKAKSILSGDWKQGTTPERWDGNTAKRIVDVLRMVRF
jgi:UDP-N-acetylglucosamine 2-epimerase (non-hydrolysing)